MGKHLLNERCKKTPKGILSPCRISATLNVKAKFDKHPLGVTEEDETEQINVGTLDKLPSADRYLKAHTNNLYLDNLERAVFEDFNSPIYTSNAAINFNSWRFVTYSQTKSP